MSRPLSKLTRLALRCDPSAPGLAREAIRAIDGIDAVRDDALLVTSELVSNAVLHAGCIAGEEIELVAEIVPTGIRIEVVDPGRSRAEPRLRDGGYSSQAGRGLRLVQALAKRWGSERRRGLHVWAELAA